MDEIYHEYLEQKKGILEGIKQGWEANKDNPDFILRPQFIEWLIRELGTGLHEYEELHKENKKLKRENKKLKKSTT